MLELVADHLPPIDELLASVAATCGPAAVAACEALVVVAGVADPGGAIIVEVDPGAVTGVTGIRPHLVVVVDHARTPRYSVSRPLW